MKVDYLSRRRGNATQAAQEPENNMSVDFLPGPGAARSHLFSPTANGHLACSWIRRRPMPTHDTWSDHPGHDKLGAIPTSEMAIMKHVLRMAGLLTQGANEDVQFNTDAPDRQLLPGSSRDISRGL